MHKPTAQSKCPADPLKRSGRLCVEQTKGSRWCAACTKEATVPPLPPCRPHNLETMPHVSARFCAFHFSMAGPGTEAIRVDEHICCSLDREWELGAWGGGGAAWVLRLEGPHGAGLGTSSRVLMFTLFKSCNLDLTSTIRIDGCPCCVTVA